MRAIRFDPRKKTVAQITGIKSPSLLELEISNSNGDKFKLLISEEEFKLRNRFHII